MKTIAFLSALLVTFSCLNAGETNDAPFFRYERPIDLEVDKPEELIRVHLDRDILAHTRQGFPDLRVVSTSGEHAPHIFEQSMKKSSSLRKKILDTSVVSFSQKDNRIILILDTHKKKSMPSHMALRTPLKDFERSVDIEGSCDQQTWTKIVDRTLLFNYSRWIDYSRTEIIIPEHRPCQYYRITIDQASEEQVVGLKSITRSRDGNGNESMEETISMDRRDFRIDGVELFNYKALNQENKPNVMKHELTYTPQPSDQKTTILHIQTDSLPLNTIRLNVSGNTFHQQALLEVSEGANSWREIARGSLYHFAFRYLQNESLELNFPEQRTKMMRLSLTGDGGKLNSIRGIIGYTSKWDLIFMAKTGQSYSLLYGSDRAKAPAPEPAAFLMQLQTEFVPLIVSLKPEVVRQEPLPQEPAPTKFNWLESKTLLYAVMGFMVLVLGWSLFNSMSKVKNEDDKD